MELVFGLMSTYIKINIHIEGHRKYWQPVEFFKSKINEPIFSEQWILQIHQRKPESCDYCSPSHHFAHCATHSSFSLPPNCFMFFHRLKLLTSTIVSSELDSDSFMPTVGTLGLGGAVPGNMSMLFSVPQVFRRIAKIPCWRLVKHLNGIAWDSQTSI